MSDKKEIQNPPAFPAWDMTFMRNPNNHMYSAGTSEGMSLIDYFAAHAPEVPSHYPYKNVESPKNELTALEERRAAWAYDYAEFMLAERQRRLNTGR